jgi:hypothetical protein
MDGSEPKILGSLGHGLAVQSDHNTSEVLIAVLHIEVDLITGGNISTIRCMRTRCGW